MIHVYNAMLSFITAKSAISHSGHAFVGFAKTNFFYRREMCDGSIATSGGQRVNLQADSLKKVKDGRMKV